MFTKTALISLVAGLAAAAPSPVKRQSPPGFGLISAHSGNEDVHLRTISAYGGHFFIGLDTTDAFCPSEPGVIDCSHYGNTTVFAGSPTSTMLSLDVAVPGGQNVFVEADGALGYTEAHSGAYPKDSYTGPFQYTPQPGPGRVGSLQFENNDFVACPATGPGEDVFQIFAAAVTPQDSCVDRSKCIGIAAATSEFTGQIAWQFDS